MPLLHRWRPAPLGDVQLMTMTVAKPTKPELHTSKIIKAGALLPDTKLLLAQWDVAASVRENLECVQRENLFGKTSRVRVTDILAVFRRRYLGDARVLAGLRLVNFQLSENFIRPDEANKAMFAVKDRGSGVYIDRDSPPQAVGLERLR